MVIAVYRSSSVNIVTLRRETTRAQRPLLWQRLYLDVVLSLLVVVGYIEYSAVQQSFGVQSLLLLGSFALIAPLLMIIAVVLLFLRVFPLLLRFFMYLVARGRGITILALIELQRADRTATLCPPGNLWHHYSDAHALLCHLRADLLRLAAAAYAGYRRLPGGR